MMSGYGEGQEGLLSVLNHLMNVDIAKTPEYLRELTTLSKCLSVSDRPTYDPVRRMTGRVCLEYRRHARVRGSVLRRGEEPGKAGFSTFWVAHVMNISRSLSAITKEQKLRYREYIKKESPTDGGTENPHPSEVL